MAVCNGSSFPSLWSSPTAKASIAIGSGSRKWSYILLAWHRSKSLFIRADRAIKLGEGLELLGLLETIDLKVNQELAWQREDEVTALE